MRAKVAKTFGGHPFQDKYTKMDHVQLLILYRYVLEEETKEKKEVRSLIKEVLEVAFKQFKGFFDETQLFINTKLFKHKKEYEERVLADIENPPDVTLDNFEDIWKELEQIVPMTVVVDYNTGMNELEEKDDSEFNKLLAGWILNKKRE